MKHKITIVVLVMAVLAAAVAARELPTVSHPGPLDCHLSGWRGLRPHFSVMMRSGSPGGVTVVARHGRCGMAKAQGMADREAGKPMRPDTDQRVRLRSVVRSRHGAHPMVRPNQKMPYG